MITDETLGKLARAQLDVGWKSGVDAAIHEVATGRTINNFGHVPVVRRALEWIIIDLRALEPPVAQPIPEVNK